jgi:hypothetical protein
MPNDDKQPRRGIIAPDIALKRFLATRPKFAEKYAAYRNVGKRRRGRDKAQRKPREPETYRNNGRRAEFGEARVIMSSRVTPTAKAIAKARGGSYIELLIRRDNPERFKEQP